MTPKVRPKKSLGQHFLTDLTVAERIAATVDGWLGEPLLEVGPGMGVLTRPLLDRGHDLTVVEIDSESIDYLKANFTELEDRIIADDFLKIDLTALYGDRKFCVIGNYPYNISSQIFFKLLDYKDSVVGCAGMLQKEVAERIAAAPGGKVRGILSVLLQAWFDVEYLFTVDENVFNPPPKVKSGVVRLTRNSVTDLGCDWSTFRTVVKTSFGQRRKMLRRSLAGMVGSTVVADDPLFTRRPEQLSVADFVRLTNIIVESRQPQR